MTPVRKPTHINNMKNLITLFCISAVLFGCTSVQPEDIPLPEHPRPDFQREAFVNLNGHWDFTFDQAIAEAGIAANSTEGFDKSILVPFPWGSELSEVTNDGDIAWYGRSITVPKEWKGRRVFVVVGASDWETSAWLDGKELGSHRGGYTPFEFEITDLASFGKPQNIFFKVDDTRVDWHLYGKQGYGDARGIWQTVYLEARGESYIDLLHFSPDIDAQCVKVDVALDSEPAEGTSVEIKFNNGDVKTASVDMSGKSASFEVAIPDQHLWSPDDPYLYEVTASVMRGGKTLDSVDSYFGQRKVSAMKVPGQDYAYVALNNSPIYLQLCLDQSYHPEGFYTFPSDEFMKNEILLSKKLGLNGNRIHIKVEVPRKLYWADELGLLIMADVPNFWGEPGPEARAEWEACMREQLKRDYNHPGIFAWVDFNETWGLFTTVDGERAYRKDTQEWVRSMYLLTKELDPTRLVEDNSPCNHDHVQTDINSWHNYCTGYNWEYQTNMYDKGTFPGSTFNYIGGNVQTDVPMINSECGNVWGYEGSAGDCDYTWDYHEMMNAFHRHPKVGGWLYTEHHDVINEWNGYVRFDRSEKFDGLDSFVPGMTIKDFHSYYYIVTEEGLCKDVAAGSTISVPIYSSFTTDKDPGKLTLDTKLVCCNNLGESETVLEDSVPVAFEPFRLALIEDKSIQMPEQNGLYTLQLILRSGNEILHRNFTTFRVSDGKDAAPAGSVLVSFAPKDIASGSWSVKQTAVMDGLKMNGFGSGFFEYNVSLPEGVDPSALKSATLLFEASAKQLFGKDIEDGEEISGDFMLGKGTYDPCKNPNAYAMTDTVCWPSEVCVSVNGNELGSFALADDPADHQGVLSWHSQLQDAHLHEAGSYGYLISVDIPVENFKAGEAAVIRFSVPENAAGRTCGGLALYGKDFGRYPMDPTIILEMK